MDMVTYFKVTNVNKGNSDVNMVQDTLISFHRTSLTLVSELTLWIKSDPWSDNMQVLYASHQNAKQWDSCSQNLHASNAKPKIIGIFSMHM